MAGIFKLEYCINVPGRRQFTVKIDRCLSLVFFRKYECMRERQFLCLYAPRFSINIVKSPEDYGIKKKSTKVQKTIIYIYNPGSLHMFDYLSAP